MKDLVSIDQELISELNLSKLAEKALSYVQKMERIEELEKELKNLKSEVPKIEAELLPQIKFQYKPKNLDFILQIKTGKTNKSTSAAKIIKLAPKICKFTQKQIEIFNQLVKDNTKLPIDKKTIQIIKE